VSPIHSTNHYEEILGNSQVSGRPPGGQTKERQLHLHATKNIVDKLTHDRGNMFVVEHILNKNQKEHET